MKRGDISKRNKKGQVTVFIIAAILIVGFAVLIYFLGPGLTGTTGFDAKTPSGFIQTCLEEDIQNAVNLVSSQGGSINPENFILYQSNKIEYLCYTTEYYKTCSTQQADLKEHIESEIKNAIKDKTANCFNELKSNYQEKGYTVNLETGETRAELLPKRVVTTFNYTLTATKTDTERFSSFNVILNNNLYELTSIANSIIDWESTYGDAETTIYMDYYKDLKVEKVGRDGSKIYILTDRNTGNKFQFASRSVVWPPGYGIEGIATNPDEI